MRALDGAPLGEWRLRLTALDALSRSGWHRFSFALEAPGGEIAAQPLVGGIHSSGGKGVAGWLEVSYACRVRWPGGREADIRACKLEGQLLAGLAAFVPPGGHLMVEYESEHQRETHAAIRLGVPPALTPLGCLLWRAGLRGGFKAWYFAEGGHEGPVKLQADRARDREDEERYARVLRGDVLAFLAARPGGVVAAAARRRARSLLEELAGAGAASR